MPPFFSAWLQTSFHFADLQLHGYAFAAIAQLGERQTEDLKVPGSIPGGGTALVAQLVEHGSNKPRVGGSSPSWSTLLFCFLQPRCFLRVCALGATIPVL